MAKPDLSVCVCNKLSCRGSLCESLCVACKHKAKTGRDKQKASGKVSITTPKDLSLLTTHVRTHIDASELRLI